MYLVTYPNTVWLNAPSVDNYYLFLIFRCNFATCDLTDEGHLIKKYITECFTYFETPICCQVIRAFVMEEVPTATDRQHRLKLLHKDLQFGAGEEGGIQVVEMVNVTKSFYMMDDEKSIIVQVRGIFGRKNYFLPEMYLKNL